MCSQKRRQFDCRLSTVQNADIIAVVDEGRVVESGKHSELIAKPGIYRNLCATQLLIESSGEDADADDADDDRDDGDVTAVEA